AIEWIMGQTLESGSCTADAQHAACDSRQRVISSHTHDLPRIQRIVMAALELGLEPFAGRSCHVHQTGQKAAVLVVQTRHESRQETAFLRSSSRLVRVLVDGMEE